METVIPCADAEPDRDAPLACQLVIVLQVQPDLVAVRFIHRGRRPLPGHAFYDVHAAGQLIFSECPGQQGIVSQRIDHVSKKEEAGFCLLLLISCF